MNRTYYTKRLVHYQELYAPDDQEVVLTHCDYAEGMDGAETILIQRLKGLLQYVEGAGATHIALEYHPQHDSYLAAAYRINPSSDQDMRDYEIAERRRETVRLLDQQIQSLQQQRELLVLIDDEINLKGNDLPF
jgi:hypothetical protein